MITYFIYYRCFDINNVFVAEGNAVTIRNKRVINLEDVRDVEREVLFEVLKNMRVK